MHWTKSWLSLTRCAIFILILGQLRILFLRPRKPEEQQQQAIVQMIAVILPPLMSKENFFYFLKPKKFKVFFFLVRMILTMTMRMNSLKMMKTARPFKALVSIMNFSSTKWLEVPARRSDLTTNPRRIGNTLKNKKKRYFLFFCIFFLFF